MRWTTVLVVSALLVSACSVDVDDANTETSTTVPLERVTGGADVEAPARDPVPVATMEPPMPAEPAPRESRTTGDESGGSVIGVTDRVTITITDPGKP